MQMQQPYQVIKFNDVAAANAAIKHLTGFVFIWRGRLNLTLAVCALLSMLL